MKPETDRPVVALAISVACGLLLHGCYLSHPGDEAAGDSSTPRDSRPPRDGADTRPPPIDGGPSCATPRFRSVDVNAFNRELGPSACPPAVRPRPARDCSFGPSTLSCGSLAGTSGANQVAAAVREDALGVVWASAGPLTRFALFDRSFRGRSRCFGTEAPSALSLAATPSGFVAAVGARGAVELHPLDRAGTPTGSVVVIDALSGPVLTSRPDGGPLLTGANGSALHALLLDEDGFPRWRTEIFDQITEPHLGSGAYLGDRFLVAMRRSPEAQVGVATVALDGTVSCVQMPSPERTEYPQLAWDGERGSITWADFSSGIRMSWVGIDDTGARTVGPVPITGRSPLFNPAPNVQVDGVSYVLAGTHTGGTYLAGRLELHRFDATGGAVAPPEDVAESPESLGGYRMIPWNDDLVALWVRAGVDREALGVALLSTTPAP